MLFSDQFQNPFSVAPSFKFWSPWIGQKTRKSEKILNTEHRKCKLDISGRKLQRCEVDADQLAELIASRKV